MQARVRGKRRLGEIWHPKVDVVFDWSSLPEGGQSELHGQSSPKKLCWNQQQRVALSRLGERCKDWFRFRQCSVVPGLAQKVGECRVTLLKERHFLAGFHLARNKSTEIRAI